MCYIAKQGGDITRQLVIVLCEMRICHLSWLSMSNKKVRGTSQEVCKRKVFCIQNKNEHSPRDISYRFDMRASSVGIVPENELFAFAIVKRSQGRSM
jgi:hypothetical protein